MAKSPEDAVMPKPPPDPSPQWIQIGPSINGDAKRGSFYIQPVALSHSGTRVVLGSAWGGGVANVKVFDLSPSRTWTEVGRFSGRDKDWFGRSIALSGDGRRLVIGANESSAAGTDSGHVEVYHQKDGGGWDKVGDNIKGLKRERFGFSVALSQNGGRVAVGAPRIGYNIGSVRAFEFVQDILKEGLDSIAGQADWGEYVMQFLGENRKQIGQTILREKDRDRFGTAIALSADGGVVAVGAPSSDDCGTSTGSVRIFRYTPIDKRPLWVPIGQKLMGTNTYDEFGRSLSINASGTILAIGAPCSNNNDGYVKVFRFRNQKWQLMGKPFVGQKKSRLGSSVSLAPRRNRLVVGSNIKKSGYIKIYDFVDEEWMQIGHIEAPPSEKHFGASVSLSGHGGRVAVGSISNNGTEDCENVTIYELCC